MNGYWYSDSPPRDHSSAWSDYPANGVKFTIPDLSLQNSMQIDVPIEADALEFPQYVWLNANGDRRCYFVDDYLMLWTTNSTQQPVMRLTLSLDDLGSAIENGFVVRGNVAVLPDPGYGTCVGQNFDLRPTNGVAITNLSGIYSYFQRTTTVVVLQVARSTDVVYTVLYHDECDSIVSLTRYWQDFYGGTVDGLPIKKFVGAWVVPWKVVRELDAPDNSKKVTASLFEWYVFQPVSVAEHPVTTRGAVNTSTMVLHPTDFSILRIGNATANVTISGSAPIVVTYHISITPSEGGVVQFLTVDGQMLNLTASSTAPFNITTNSEETAINSGAYALSMVGAMINTAASAVQKNPVGVLNGIGQVYTAGNSLYTNRLTMASINGQALLSLVQDINGETLFTGFISAVSLHATDDTDYLNACEKQYGYNVTNFGLLEFYTFSPRAAYTEGFVQIPNACISVTKYGAYKRAISAKDLAAYFNRGIYFYTP